MHGDYSQVSVGCRNSRIELIGGFTLVAGLFRWPVGALSELIVAGAMK